MNQLLPPATQTTKSRDGTKIAYAVAGRGYPLVLLSSFPATHLEFEWRLPDRHRLFTRLAGSTRLIRLDYRGSGLSAREPEALSLETLADDVEAVLSALNVTDYALLAVGNSAPVAIELAARRATAPEKLVLWQPMVTWLSDPAVDALMTIVEHEWDVFLRTRYRIRWSQPEADELASLTRASISPAMFKRARELWSGVDQSSKLDYVEAETLIVTGTATSAELLAQGELSRRRIPHAQLTQLDGDVANPFVRDHNELHHLLAEFLELPPTEEADVSLTRRELEIVRLTAQGMRTKEVAAFLGLSPATVDRHLANVYQKTGAHNRVALTRYALRLGLATV